MIIKFIIIIKFNFFKALTVFPVVTIAVHPRLPALSMRFPIAWHSARTLTAGYSLCRELSLSQDPSLTLSFIAQRLPYTLTKQQKVPQLTQTVTKNIQRHPN